MTWLQQTFLSQEWVIAGCALLVLWTIATTASAFANRLNVKVPVFNTEHTLAGATVLFALLFYLPGFLFAPEALEFPAAFFLLIIISPALLVAILLFGIAHLVNRASRQRPLQHNSTAKLILHVAIAGMIILNTLWVLEFSLRK